MKKKREYTDWKQKKTKKKNRQVIHTILKDGPKRFKELFEKVEFSETTLSRILDELSKDGSIKLIIVDGKNRAYCLNKKEQSEVEKLKSMISGISGFLQEQIQLQKAFGKYFETGSTEDLKKVDPLILNFYGYQKTLETIGMSHKIFRWKKKENRNIILR